jgi:hypothetical protein
MAFELATVAGDVDCTETGTGTDEVAARATDEVLLLRLPVR